MKKVVGMLLLLSFLFGCAGYPIPPRSFYEYPDPYPYYAYPYGFDGTYVQPGGYDGGDRGGYYGGHVGSGWAGFHGRHSGE